MKSEFALVREQPPQYGRLAVTTASRFTPYSAYRIGGFDFDSVHSSYLYWQILTYDLRRGSVIYQLDLPPCARRNGYSWPLLDLAGASGSGEWPSLEKLLDDAGETGWTLTYRCPASAVVGLYEEYPLDPSSALPAMNHVLVVQDKFLRQKENPNAKPHCPPIH